MKKIGVLVFLAAIVACLFTGCSEDTTLPVITRLDVSQQCGIAPLYAEFRGFASGGVPFDAPTGGNVYLEFEWDFGDGNSATTAQVYNRYDDPGIYEVTLTVTDAEGKQDTRSMEVEVRAEAFDLWMFRDPETAQVDTNTVVTFRYEIQACNVVRGDSTSYTRFAPTWTLLDTVITEHEFSLVMPDTAVLDTIRLEVDYFTESVIKTAEMPIEVVVPAP